MTDAVTSLVSRIDDDRPFEFERRDVASLWLDAANARLAERRQQIPALAAWADQAGLERVTDLRQLLPLLLTHATYKSYPRALLDKGKWSGLTRWLDTVATESITDVDLTGSHHTGRVDGRSRRRRAPHLRHQRHERKELLPARDQGRPRLHDALHRPVGALAAGARARRQPHGRGARPVAGVEPIDRVLPAVRRTRTATLRGRTS